MATKEQSKQYYQKHKDQCKKTKIKYNHTHKKVLTAYHKTYYEENKEKVKEQTHAFYLTHKELYRDKMFMRQKGLGYETPINKRYDGSEGHHLNKTEVVFITKGLHRSIWHNLKTGKGMAEINHLALLEVFGGEC